MWNTGCYTIGNGLDCTITITDSEDTSKAITITPGKTVNWNGVIFPWCENSDDVKTKAFRVSPIIGASNAIYLFQNFIDDELYYIISPYSTPDFDKKKSISSNAIHDYDSVEKLPKVDIYFTPSCIFALASQGKEKKGEEILTEALASQIAKGDKSYYNTDIQDAMI